MGEVTPLDKLIAALEAGKKPDLRSLGVFIQDKLSPMREDDWNRLSAALCKTYSFGSPAELSQHIRTPLFTSSDAYVDDFSPLLKSIELGGWVGRYVEHTRNMEAPTAYHFAVGYTILGAALRRQVYVNQGYYQIWPAVQSILIGPAGRTRKSTAASYGVNLGEAAERLYRLADEGTQEALKSELAQLSRRGDACGLIFASELSVFLGREEYSLAMVKSLTDLFDARTSIRRRTQSRGNELMKNLAVSFLGCSNEDWVAELPKSAFGGGFLSRILLWHQTGTDRCFPRPKILDSNEFEELRTELLRTQFTSGEAVLDDSAEKFFTDRYMYIKDNWPVDERLAPFWERLHDHLLKMGMLLAISEDMAKPKPLITERHLQQANEILMWIVKGLPKVYSYFGMSPFSQEQKKLISLLQRSGGIMSEADLGRRMKLPKRLLQEHIETLEKYRILTKRKPIGEWDGEWEYRLLRKSEEV